MERSVFSIAAVILLVLGFAWWSYQPGLTGTFLFDDHSNLDRLSDLRLDGVYQFLASQTRPLSFLSFLINDTSWPSNARGFLYTNIQLHFICALLLAWFVYRLFFQLPDYKQHAAWVALLASTYWLLHPLFVSTTLYIVQRMSILSCLFVLLSLLFYVIGRSNVGKHNWLAGICLIPGVVISGILGLLCKQNTALLPVFLLVLESVFYVRQPVLNNLYRIWRATCVYLPVLVLFAAVFVFQDRWLGSYEIRHFTLLERLMTESRVLWYYLSLIFIPRTSTNGLHFENYSVSHGLLDPLTTLLSVAGIILVVALSSYYRRKNPVLCSAVLFFFAGHLLESTFYPLELYYEHRNYLPTIMLFVATSCFLVNLTERRRNLAIAAAISIALVLGVTTHSRASLWGNPILLMAIWTKNNPGSARNFAEASMLANQLHRPDIAKYYMQAGAEALPDEVHLQLGLLAYQCQDGTLDRDLIEHTTELLNRTEQVMRVYLHQNVKQLVTIYNKPICSGITYDDLVKMLTAMLNNPKIRKYQIRQQEVLYLYGLLELSQNNFLSAIEKFRVAFLLNPQPQVALQQIAVLGSNQVYQHGLEYLEYTRDTIYFGSDCSGMPGCEQFLDLEQRLQTALLQEDRN